MKSHVLALALVAAFGCASHRDPVVALLTDYGTPDSYVGELKGSLLSANPDARIVDLTHEAPPYDIREGAWLLWQCAKEFPRGTVFVGVVDPGVGTSRKGIAVRSAAGHYFVGPDNGLFSWIYAQEGPCTVVELTEKRFWRSTETSTTFHGRDIFGPVAGHLAAGAALEELGPVVANPQKFVPVEGREEGGALVGEIVHVDWYGNVSTNIPAKLATGAAYVAGGITFPREVSYGSVASGDPVLVADSKGHVELALNMASLGAKTGWKAGAQIRLEPAPAAPPQH